MSRSYRGPPRRPRIVDFLHLAAASGRPVAGIINADVVFLKGPTVAADIIANARDGMVMIERINISPQTMAPTHQSCFGFDAFIFDTRRLATLSMDPAFRIGDTWWDYCFPLAYHRNGGMLKRSRAPLLMHLDHPQNWDDTQYLANGGRSYAAFATLVGGATASPPISDPDVTTICDFSRATFAWLRSTARVIDAGQADAAAA